MDGKIIRWWGFLLRWRSCCLHCGPRGSGPPELPARLSRAAEACRTCPVSHAADVLPWCRLSKRSLPRRLPVAIEFEPLTRHLNNGDDAGLYDWKAIITGAVGSWQDPPWCSLSGQKLTYYITSSGLDGAQKPSLDRHARRVLIQSQHLIIFVLWPAWQLYRSPHGLTLIVAWSPCCPYFTPLPSRGTNLDADTSLSTQNGNMRCVSMRRCIKLVSIIMRPQAWAKVCHGGPYKPCRGIQDPIWAQTGMVSEHATLSQRFIPQGPADLAQQLQCIFRVLEHFPADHKTSACETSPEHL